MNIEQLIKLEVVMSESSLGPNGGKLLLAMPMPSLVFPLLLLIDKLSQINESFFLSK